MTPYTGPAVFHIGLIKTGTTWLQKAVFCKPDLGMAIAGGANSRAHLVNWFITGDDYRWDPAQVAAEMASLEIPAREQGMVPIWSDETLIGNPLTRAYHGYQVMQKIAALKRPAKVLITLREQRALVLSAFREFAKQGGRHSLSDFIGTGTENTSFTPLLREGFLHYDIVIRAWMAKFGAENVLCLPQELLRDNPEAYLDRLRQFLELKNVLHVDQMRQNKGMGATALHARLLLNRFYVRSPLSHHGSFGERLTSKICRGIDHLTPASLDEHQEKAMKVAINKRYSGCFSSSNQRLDALTNLELQKLGYQL